MRYLLLAVAFFSAPAYAQATYSPTVTLADMATAQQTANSAATAAANAQTTANTATSTANAAQAAANAAVKTVNSTSPDGSGNVAVVLPTSFLPGFTNTSPGTLANLYATAPCNASRANQFATVIDLYGTVTETMRCTYFGSWGYQYRPQRADYATQITSTSGTITISCNITAPALSLSGTLTGPLSINFTSTNCTPGQRQELQNGLTLGIYSVTATGLVGAVTSKVLGALTTSTYIYDAAGWRAY